MTQLPKEEVFGYAPDTMLDSEKTVEVYLSHNREWMDITDWRSAEHDSICLNVAAALALRNWLNKVLP